MMPRRYSSVLMPVAALTTASSFLVACTPIDTTKNPIPANTEPPPDSGPPASISISGEHDLVKVPIDQNITTWLNTVDDKATVTAPVPDLSDWNSFAMPATDEILFIDAQVDTPFDLLEILAYPDGLDPQGIPITTEVHPLCGPQADTSCVELAENETKVGVDAELVRSAIEGSEYFAIGGIFLPDGDSHPDSFMALFRQATSLP